MKTLRGIGIGGLAHDAIEAGILASLVVGLDLAPAHLDDFVSLASVEVSADHGYGITESGQEAVRRLLDVVAPEWGDVRAPGAPPVEASPGSRVESLVAERDRLAGELSEARRFGEHQSREIDLLGDWLGQSIMCLADRNRAIAARDRAIDALASRVAEVMRERDAVSDRDSMASEYDFSGARRGLFLRGGRRVRLPADALWDLISKVVAWARLNRFDDDQDPGLDSPAQGVVRALDRWQAIAGAGRIDAPASEATLESRIRALEAGLAEAIEWAKTDDYDGAAIDRLVALLVPR